MAVFKKFRKNKKGVVQVTAKELIKIEMEKRTRLPRTELARRLGISRQALESKMTSSDKTDLRIDDAAKILNKLGWRVSFIPKYHAPIAGEIVYPIDSGNRGKDSECFD